MATSLALDTLQVTSFETSAAEQSSTRIGGGGWCCTGCDSGCGIFPTECYCESQGESGDGFCLPQDDIEL